MKNVTKILVTAAAVAAVTGVGAVSFAAWSASVTPVSQTGATGVINTIGNLTVTAIDASKDGDNLKALFPVDQEGTISGVKYWGFTVKADTTGDASPTFTLVGTLATGSETASTDKGSAALYWSSTVPTAVVSANAISSDAENATTITLGANDVVYVYMDASGTDAMLADITLTFSAS